MGVLGLSGPGVSLPRHTGVAASLRAWNSSGGRADKSGSPQAGAPRPLPSPPVPCLRWAPGFLRPAPAVLRLWVAAATGGCWQRARGELSRRLRVRGPGCLEPAV